MMDATDQAARELADRLAALREIGPYPEPTVRSRPAKAAELPRNAATIMSDARDPWTVQALYALGAVPYSWDRRAGGYMLADSIAVRIAHPDGRRGVGTWIRNAITVRKGEHVLTWKWYEGWRWRVGEHGSFPAPCGARALKTAVADPTAERSLNLIQHLKLTMQDLHSRDPQIADSIEVALLELETDEQFFQAVLRSDYRELRRLHRKGKS